MAEHHYRGVPITPTADGRWQAKVTVGRTRDGRLDRRKREGKTVAEVREKLRKLMREVDAGRKPAKGRSPALAEWLNTWITDIAPHGQRAIRPATARSYRAVIDHWIVPELGGIPIDDLEPDDLDRLHTVMRRAGKAESYILKAHYVMRRSLKVAMRRGKLGRNVAELVDPPGGSEGDRTPLPRQVVKRALEVAMTRRNAARWALGMATGLRQGETLGLTWDHVDLAAAVIRREWQLQRITRAHGCDDPVECAARWCRREPCPPTWKHGCQAPDRCRIQAWRCPQRQPGQCRLHTRACPAPCPPGCTGHARKCPQKTGGLLLVRPKTWRPHRPLPPVAIPAPVVKMLRQHQVAQDKERDRAANMWRQARYPDGRRAQLVFTQVDGGPVDPRRDWQDWQDILLAAGADPARVHALRHTAATTLLELGVDIAVAQELLGHTDIRTTRGYVSVVDTLTREAADRMGAALFGLSSSDRVSDNSSDTNRQSVESVE